VKGLLVRVLIIAAIAGGGFLLRDRLTGSAGDLQVGDCFTATEAETVSDVQHHPCTEAHNAEVFFVGDYPAADNAALPPISAFESFVDTSCGPALISYLGGESAIVADPTLMNLDLGYYHPIADGWSKGDREIICFIASSTPTLTRSVKAGQ
jgi:hypothetical protein